MWRTNLTVALIVLGTLGLYTAVANLIPQVASDVPEELVMSADVSSEEMVAAGEQLYAGGGGCTACHGLGTRAPDLLGVVGTL
jgi:mono/diheme cytochrome c family protein